MNSRNRKALRRKMGNTVFVVGPFVPASVWKSHGRQKPFFSNVGSALIGCLLALVVGAWAFHALPATMDATEDNHAIPIQWTVSAGTTTSDDQGPPTIYWDGRCVRSPFRRRARRKVHRTRSEIEQERKELLEKTNREIDAIVADYHAKLPREQASGIAAIYARYSSRFQDSIADQVRALFEAAFQLGLFIPRELVFFDMAVRGWKDRRPGLSALRQALKRKEFDVFLVFTTSRLFRRTYKALQFVEEELVERGIRGVFVKSHLDTADGDNWRTTFQLFAAMDEAMVRMYADHVRAAHEGLFLRGMVYGSLPLGYTGEIVPGEFTKRKRPRRRIIIDPETAPWIKRIYHWYVDERLAMDEIARRLNDDPNAPAPAKSLTGLWTHDLVRTHLLNPCYRGWWSYGAAQTKWSSDKDYAQRVPRVEPLKSKQVDELRIVSDDLWYAAQKWLAEEVSKSGRKPKDGDRKSRPNLLRAIFYCPQHERSLFVGGPFGRALLCPLCRATKAEERPLFSHLNRALALRLTCEKLAELVRLDEDLVSQIIAACQQEADAAQRPDPEAERQLRSKLDKLTRTIEFNRRNPGENDREQQDTKRLLMQLRSERAAVEADLSAIEAAKGRVITPPTAEVVRAMLSELGDILTQAAGASSDAQLSQARRIIELLTGSRIELFQMGERKAQRGWLQGRFRVRLLSFLVERVTGVRPLGRDEGVEVAIDYREPPEFVSLSEKAKAMYDTGMMCAVIAKELGCARSYVTKLLRYWYESRGLAMPDGRGRRSTLQQKHLEPPLYQRIADEVMRLFEQHLLLEEIAKQLQVDRNTVTSAIRWWHQSRGLPVPDGRTRRKQLDVKSSRKPDSQESVSDDQLNSGLKEGEGP